MLVKEVAKQLIDTLPDQVTMDDIIHALYIRVKVEHGLEDIRTGNVISHAEAKTRMYQKWVK